MIDLRLGDCLEILPTLADKSVDAIITDIPYGTTACKWDVIIPLDAMWEQVKRLCKGAFVTTASQPFTSVLVMSNLDWFKYEWIWRKSRSSGFLNAKKMPLKNVENIAVFSQNGHTYNPQDLKRISRVRSNGFSKGTRSDKGLATHNGGRLVGNFVQEFENYPNQVLEFTSEANGDHPTQKPVALYEYLIKTYTNAGDTVLDFCMGSGTTGVACVKTGRNFIGIEKERNYFEIAERRIAEAQMQTVMEFA